MIDARHITFQATSGEVQHFWDGLAKLGGVGADGLARDELLRIQQSGNDLRLNHVQKGILALVIRSTRILGALK
ncbi:MAG: hypothetical protein EB085_12960 [Betaproteobacteria bacterium]|nr:hypothetical protein [Betaproteobacteria bacterium]